MTNASDIRFSLAQHEDSDDYCGNYLTREEAFAAGLEKFEGAPFVIATGRMAKASKCLPSVESILDVMTEKSYDFSENDPSFNEASGEAKAELGGLLAGWADKHLTVNFWDDIDSLEYVPAADGWVNP